MSLTQSLTDTCENVGAKIELMHNSGDAENLTEKEPNNFILRVGKPGKLYLQPNYSAFTKSSLGTIPSKIEKTLLKTDTNIPISSSINNTLLSGDSKNTSTSDTFYTYKHPKSYTTSYSSKGYGVGFVSKVDRFKNDFKNYSPGPGDYSPDRLYTVENNIKMSDLGKSLFLNPASKSLQLLQVTDNNKALYSSQEKDKNNKEETIKTNNNKKDNNYYFKSNTNRFHGGLFSLKNKYPGPGKYFIDTEYKIRNPDKLSPNFMDLQQKLISPIKYFKLNINDKKQIGFKIQDKMKLGKVTTFWKGVPSLGNTYDFGKTITKIEKNKKENIINKNLNDYKNVISMPDFQSTQELRKNKFFRTNPNDKYLPSISEEKQVKKEIIISNLLKNKNRNLLGLAPPRWDEGIYHDNDSHFQVPGPAYYDPKVQTVKKSFNLNTKDFIYTNSIPYQTINGNMPTSGLIT